MHDVNTGCFSYRGHELRYVEHGSGDRVVVLLDGLLLDANVNRRLARAFASHGYRVVLLDLLGHGRSDKHPNADRLAPRNSSAISN